ncbi:MAG: hypothetical protein VX028_03215 [Nanoarchaeota archaeon]|nr:hypothetical protein [Nanoarchaeota archaeon]MEC8339711.1 hypothetical protein [Nanoarchaeota archaeon]
MVLSDINSWMHTSQVLLKTMLENMGKYRIAKSLNSEVINQEFEVILERYQDLGKTQLTKTNNQTILNGVEAFKNIGLILSRNMKKEYTPKEIEKLLKTIKQYIDFILNIELEAPKTQKRNKGWFSWFSFGGRN